VIPSLKFFKASCLAFCDEEEKAFLKDIEKVISKPIPVIEEHPYPVSNISITVNKDNNVKKASNEKSRSTGYARRNGRNHGGRQHSKNAKTT